MYPGSEYDGVFSRQFSVVSVEDYKVVEYLDDIGWDIYIRMEYLTSFLDYCAGRALSEDDVIHLGIDLCKALEYCQCPEYHSQRH